jgi:uncharacterized protein (DUF58 family)
VPPPEIDTQLTLTRRGWTLGGASAGLIVGSRFLGTDELASLGIAAAVLLVVALAWAATRRTGLDLARHLVPPRLHVGGEGRVVVEGTTTMRTPLLTLTDAFDDGRRAAHFVLPPRAPAAGVRATYRVPTNRRGRFTVGPLVASASDPLGLARRTTAVAGTTDLVVCPRVHDVLPPRPGGGGEPAVHDDGPRSPALEPLGEFLALREYQAGDDPRRVHWRSSARVGELLVRQDEAAAPGRIAVVLDTRPEVYDTATFEVAVEATASVAASLRRARRPIEVLSTAGEILGRPGAGADLLLDRLAVVQPSGPDHLPAVVATLRSRLGLGAVVSVTGAVDDELVDALALLRRRRAVTVVATRPSPAARALAASGLTVVDTSRASFSVAWNEAMTARPRTRWQHAGSR